MVFKFWKAHGRMIMQLIERPVSNNTQGIKTVDWEVSLTTQSRHQANIRKKSATVLLHPNQTTGNRDGRIMFEVTKGDVDMILSKLDSVL